MIGNDANALLSLIPSELDVSRSFPESFLAAGKKVEQPPKLTRVHKCIYCVMGGHSKRVQWTFLDSLINALHMELFTVQTKSDEMFQNEMNF